MYNRETIPETPESFQDTKLRISLTLTMRNEGSKGKRNIAIIMVKMELISCCEALKRLHRGAYAVFSPELTFIRCNSRFPFLFLLSCFFCCYALSPESSIMCTLSCSFALGLYRVESKFFVDWSQYAVRFHHTKVTKGVFDSPHYLFEYTSSRLLDRSPV